MARIRWPLALMVVALAVLQPVLPTAHAATRKVSFNACGFKNGFWTIAQRTSKFLTAVPGITDDAFEKQKSQLLDQIAKANKAYGGADDSRAKTIVADLQSSLQAASTAIDGRDLGVSEIYASGLTQAWAQLNPVWKLLTPYCPLGHPTSVQEQVNADGNTFGGLEPLPISSPWLSLRQKWQIYWWYNCTRRPFGFRVEVRGINNSVSLAETANNTYIGPFLALAVDQHGKVNHGISTMQGQKSLLYLLVRSQCRFSIKVVG